MKKDIFKLYNSKGVLQKYRCRDTIEIFGKEFIIFEKYNPVNGERDFRFIIYLYNYIETSKSYPFGNRYIIGYYDENNNLVYGENVKKYIDNMILISAIEGKKYEEMKQIKQKYRWLL